MWTWAISGTQKSDGTVSPFYGDSGSVCAEFAGEVLQWLADAGPVWNNLDTDQPFTVTVGPAAVEKANDD